MYILYIATDHLVFVYCCIQRMNSKGTAIAFWNALIWVLTHTKLAYGVAPSCPYLSLYRHRSDSCLSRRDRRLAIDLDLRMHARGDLDLDALGRLAG
jgi:hypothetical protein